MQQNENQAERPNIIKKKKKQNIKFSQKNQIRQKKRAFEL